MKRKQRNKSGKGRKFRSSLEILRARGLEGIEWMLPEMTELENDIYRNLYNKTMKSLQEWEHTEDQDFHDCMAILFEGWYLSNQLNETKECHEQIRSAVKFLLVLKKSWADGAPKPQQNVDFIVGVMENILEWRREFSRPEFMQCYKQMQNNLDNLILECCGEEYISKWKNYGSK